MTWTNAHSVITVRNLDRRRYYYGNYFYQGSKSFRNPTGQTKAEPVKEERFLMEEEELKHHVWRALGRTGLG